MMLDFYYYALNAGNFQILAAGEIFVPSMILTHSPWSPLSLRQWHNEGIFDQCWTATLFSTLKSFCQGKPEHRLDSGADIIISHLYWTFKPIQKLF
jgi:hypothetical protein